MVLHLPAFRLERCGYLADEVAGLVTEMKSAARLVAVTPEARRQGLREQMTTSQARALVPDVLLEPLDLEGEAVDRIAVLRAFSALSDRITPLDRPEGKHETLLQPVDIVLEVHRTAHLFGGEPELLRRARELGAELGHEIWIAIADDPLAAAALCSPREDSIVPPAGHAPVLAPLPIRALRPSETLEAALRAVGIVRIEQLAALDRASVAGRFGEEGVRLHRVAAGESVNGRTLVAEGDLGPCTVSVVFGHGVTNRQAVAFVLPGLVRQLCHQLASRDEAAVRMALRFRLERHAQPRSLSVRSGRPTRSAALIERLVLARIEGLELDAPVCELQIEVEEAVSDPGWQPGLTDRTTGAEALPDLLARLTDALGEEAIFYPVLTDAWRPEARYRPEHPRAGGAVQGSLALARIARDDRDDPVYTQEQWEPTVRPRPLLLGPHPQPLEVEPGPGGPARILLDRRGWIEVVAATGPERIEGEWWSDNRFERDYWVVELAHGEGVAWIFLEDRRWYLHGWFD